MELSWDGLEFSLRHDDSVIFECRRENPFVYVGMGQEKVDMCRGNFQIEDYLIERIPLYVTNVQKTERGIQLEFGNQLEAEMILECDCVTFLWRQKNPDINRFWIRLSSDKEEKCYGCGEQLSYFNLRGRHFPIWTSEPGNGRDKTTYITWRSDVENGGGGDYYNTYYPQPTFVSSHHYYVHVDSNAYADFDFRNDEFHELQVWEVPKSIRVEGASSFVSLLEKESAFFGHQPELPEWIYNGLIMGVQGGDERSFGLLEKTLDHGIEVAALWCQDWCGKRVTSFGKRLQWDWKYNHEMYPDLPKRIEEIHKRGIKFLGYVNPYLVKDGELFKEGEEKGVFVTTNDGKIRLVDFGEFECGIVDFTDEKAYQWFKDEVIKKHSLGIGVDGWMADFGEFLPTDDIVLHNGNSAMIEHNHWPALWAKCNYEAVKEEGKLEQVVYFMRAGATGSQKYCTLLWAGDQSVDFTIHDGLASVICAALSAGMTGCGLSHSDIGGYTSLYGNTRTKELFLRWAEMAVFTPVMRTHEGNRPDENFQYYNDDDCMTRLARLVQIYKSLSPYTKKLVEENAERGIPVQRPLFIHYEQDERSYEIQYEYLFGRDILVAPVYLADRTDWEVYLPEDNWVHLWTGAEYGKGVYIVDASLGEPPVFYRKNSEYASLFQDIREKYGTCS